MGLSNVDIKEPNRAIYEDDYLIINGLDKEIVVYDPKLDEEYTVPAESRMGIPFDTDYQMSIYVPNYDWDNDTPVWYAVFDGPNIPMTPEWTYTNTGSTFNIPGGGYNHYGIGVYYEYNLPTNEDFYIDTSLKGGVTKGLADWTGEMPLIPPNSTIRIYKEDGTYATLNNLYIRRANVENSSLYDVLIYTKLGTNSYMNIANNKGFTQQYFQGFSTLSDPMKLQPYVKYYNGYTNKIRFVSGTYEKNALAENGLGFVPLTNYGLSEYVTGYIGYSEGGVDESVVALTGGMGLVASSFLIVSSFFGYMVFPGISIGLLLCIPLIMELIFVIIKVIKKGA